MLNTGKVIFFLFPRRISGIILTLLHCIDSEQAPADRETAPQRAAFPSESRPGDALRGHRIPATAVRSKQFS